MTKMWEQDYFLANFLFATFHNQSIKPVWIKFLWGWGKCGDFEVQDIFSASLLFTETSVSLESESKLHRTYFIKDLFKSSWIRHKWEYFKALVKSNRLVTQAFTCFYWAYERKKICHSIINKVCCALAEHNYSLLCKITHWDF